MMPAALALAMRHPIEIALAIAVLLATLSLEAGVVIGALLVPAFFLHRIMQPRVAILGCAPDGTLRDAKADGLPASDVAAAVRFVGHLYFGNASRFEEAVLEAVANNPAAPCVLIVGDGIGSIDASGEAAIRRLVEQLAEGGVAMVFTGLRKPVLDVMQATGLREAIGERRFFPTADQALETLRSRADENHGLPGKRYATLPASPLRGIHHARRHADGERPGRHPG